ncbi:MAG: PilZ domain-containing protein [Terriglobales bacterium]
MAAGATHEFVNKALSISLWGMDSSLKPFTATAMTHRIAEDAVEVDFTRRLEIGELIGLGYQGQRSRFRVLQSFLAGLSLYRVTLQDTGTKCMWKAEMASPDPIVLPNERRRESRYPMAAVAMLFDARGVSTSAKLLDVSRSGCYVELHSPAPVGISMRVLLLLPGNQQADITAIVRTSHPGIGMGMEIVAFGSDDDRVRLHELVEALEARQG